MDKVVGMMEKDVGDGESIGELAVTDEGHRADDADALLPDGLAIAGQFIQQRAVLVEQPHAQQRIARQVHQVPVVDIPGMIQIEVDT